MIWVDGQILPDDGLSISVLDRTFEHGLGLFETLRTWGGRPTLLEKHKARMLRSAEVLKLPIDPATLPDAEDVRALLDAEGVEEDRRLRITATGGSQSGSVVWMKSSSLGKHPSKEGVRVVPGSWAIGHDDPLARHKTLNYWARRLAFEAASRQGYDETLILTRDDEYCEGAWSNLFVVRGGELLTPSLDAPIIPGVMRRLVLEAAGELLLPVREVQGIKDQELREADEVFLTNSVRGITPVAAVAIRFRPPAISDSLLSEGEGASKHATPGPWTQQLQGLVARRLWPDRGGAETP